MSNQSTLKKKNVLSILEAIRLHKQITKSELVRITELNQSTVNNLINELLEKQLVIEEGTADSNGGRRACLFRFNADYFYIVALDVGDTYISGSVFNFDLNEVFRTERKYVLKNNSVEDGLDQISALIRACIANSGVSLDRFAGIGISVSGPVDFENGKIYQITDAPKWKNIPLAHIIKSRFGLETLIDKDNNAATLYYKLFTQQKKNASLVFLSTRKGIGTGFLLDGYVYRGRHCLAGEIGHMPVETSGEQCKCGKTGCIEPLASDPGIINHYIKKRTEERGYKASEHLSLQDIVKLAEDGDGIAADVLKNTAGYLSIVIGNIIKTYDPDEIILDVSWLGDCSKLYKEIVNRVYEENEFIDRDHLIITLNQESNILLYGAASLIIYKSFDSYDSRLL